MDGTRTRSTRAAWALTCATAVLCSIAIAVAGIRQSQPFDLKHQVKSAAPIKDCEPYAELREGNARYVASRRTRSTDTAHDAEWRHRLSKGQHPIATVLCCADSRVCPEFIFDQRMGSIFEVRNAGNVVDEDVMASLEYAVEHLHVPLIVVLGHKGCGAIAAVHDAGDVPLHDHLRALQDHMQGIREEVLRARDDHSPDLLNRLSKENARQQAIRLRHESDPIRQTLARGDCALMYGIYDMETGIVEFFELD